MSSINISSSAFGSVRGFSNAPDSSLPAHNGIVFSSVLRFLLHLSKTSSIPYLGNFFEPVYELILLSKFLASSIFTFIVACHILRVLSFSVISNESYSSPNFSQSSSDVSILEDDVDIETFEIACIVLEFVKTLIVGLLAIPLETLAFKPDS